MNTYRTLTAAFVTTAALMAGAAPATAMLADGDDFGTTTTHRERGIVLECTGEAGGLEAYASLYENDKYGNVLQVVLGEGNGRSKNVKRPFLEDGKVRGTITIDGAKAKIRGTAETVGKKKKVHEVHDDAGYLITIDGTHRRLANDLVLTYDGTSVPLTCDSAFRYDLMVTKEQVV